MRRKGAGFFGVKERKHVANYSVYTILYEPHKEAEWKHILEKIYYVLVEYTIFIFSVTQEGANCLSISLIDLDWRLFAKVNVKDVLCSTYTHHYFYQNKIYGHRIYR